MADLACLHRADIPKPSLTRPKLTVLPQLHGHDEYLFGADDHCAHYVTYRGWSGVMCVRCNGWYCA